MALLALVQVDDGGGDMFDGLRGRIGDRYQLHHRPQDDEGGEQPIPAQLYELFPYDVQYPGQHL